MARYLVQVNASNLLVDMDGRRGKYGFITLRKVEAADHLAAGQLAVQMIKDDETDYEQSRAKMGRMA